MLVRLNELEKYQLTTISNPTEDGLEILDSYYSGWSMPSSPSTHFKHLMTPCSAL